VGSEQVSRAMTLYWSYTPPRGINTMINISLLHQYKLSYIMPLLTLSSTEITFHTSTLKIIKIINENSPQRLFDIESTDILDFNSNMKGQLKPRLKSSSHMDLVSVGKPIFFNTINTGKSDEKQPEQKLFWYHWIPATYEPISIATLLDEEYEGDISSIYETSVSIPISQEIYPYVFANMCTCEFGLGHVMSMQIDNNIVKKDFDLRASLMEINIPMLTNMYSLEGGIDDAFEIDTLIPHFARK
jgi:hypothetical protein